jgi:hypothetical protein
MHGGEAFPVATFQMELHHTSTSGNQKPLASTSSTAWPPAIDPTTASDAGNQGLSASELAPDSAACGILCVGTQQ